MSATEDPPTTVPEERPIGYGRLKRKEDPRFIRGRGKYVDDVVLPGMLHGAVLRSPFAHARIVSIDVSAAQQHPKVHAVITGQDLAGLNLAWMPTLSGDVQAVLATDAVRFQGQEVAFVVADDRYSARDALELIQVEYEALPPVIDARKALDPGAPVIRTDLDGKTDNHIFDWEAGDAAATDAVFADAEVVVAQDIVYPRCHPAPMETCGSVADFDKVDGKLTLWLTSQAPHAHRTLFAIVAGLPEHKIRVISPDIGGGFGNKVPVYPGYVCSVVGSILTGRPVKWMEDRSENLMTHGLRPRLPDARRGRRHEGRPHPGGARPHAGRPRRLQRHRAAHEVPGRVLPHLHRLVRLRGGPLQGHRRLHEQGARRRGLPLLLPRHRGGVPDRAADRLPGGRARHRSRGAADEELHPARAVPVPEPDGLDLRLRRLRDGHAQGAGDGRLRRAAGASRPRSGRAAS